ncbi:MAG: 2OG-Fe(II) oxygenase [Alphaproteobacteria bacterium]
MYRTHVVIPGVLAADECAVLRALEPKLEFRAGTVSLVRAEQPETRRSRVAWLRRDEEHFAWLFARIDRVLAAVNLHHFDVDYAQQGCAAFQYSIYDADKRAHHYTTHIDDFLPASWPDARQLSVVAQLSAPGEYGGGTLRFRDVADEMPQWGCERGTALVLPSILYHSVETVYRRDTALARRLVQRAAMAIGVMIGICRKSLSQSCGRS